MADRRSLPGTCVFDYAGRMMRDAIGVGVFVLAALPVLLWAMTRAHFLRGGILLCLVATGALAGAVRLAGASPALATVAYLLCLLLAATLLLTGTILAVARRLGP